MLLPLFWIACSLIFWSNAQSLGGFCKTPHGESAKCVSIYQCNSLLTLVQLRDRTADQLKFLRDSRCGTTSTGTILVCCGRNIFQTTPEEDNPNEPFQPNPAIPSRTECGIQTAPRIFNGEETALDEFPWMAILQYQSRSGAKKFACGGTLINPRYILTAAHCIVGEVEVKIGQLINVRLGEWDTSSPNRDCRLIKGFQVCNDPEVNVGIEATVVHPNYDGNSRSRAHDIALIRLKQEVHYSDFIKPICLPLPTDESRAGDNLTVAGWGKTEKGRNSNVKLKLIVPFANKDDCTNLFKTESVYLGKGQICAGGQSGKDSCSGDSGGPLMRTFRTDTERWYLEGVVSFGNACGTDRWPGVYTKVSNYISWIHKNVKS